MILFAGTPYDLKRFGNFFRVLLEPQPALFQPLRCVLRLRITFFAFRIDEVVLLRRPLLGLRLNRAQQLEQVVHRRRVRRCRALALRILEDVLLQVEEPELRCLPDEVGRLLRVVDAGQLEGDLILPC